MELAVGQRPLGRFLALTDEPTWRAVEVIDRLNPGPVGDGDTNTATKDHGDPTEVGKLRGVLGPAEANMAVAPQGEPQQEHHRAQAGEQIEPAEVTGGETEQLLDDQASRLGKQDQGNDDAENNGNRRPEYPTVKGRAVIEVAHRLNLLLWAGYRAVLW